MADWSNLPWDLLHLIFENLSVPDILRSTAVCSSWSSAVTDFRGHRHELRRQSPCLICYHEGATKLFSLSEQRFYNIHRQLEGHGRFCIGSGHGWLILANVTAPTKLHLLNPITGAHINLPPIDTAFLAVPKCWSYFAKAVLSSNPSSGGYTVVLIQSIHRHQLAFVRPGDEEWTMLSTGTGRKMLTDVIFYRDRFYTVTSTGTMEVWDLSRSSSTVVALEPDSNWEKNRFDYFLFHLVETPWGDLLQIWRRYFYRTENIDKKLFDVFKVDVERGRLIEVDNLAQHAIIFGYNYSFCLSSCDFPEFRPNHIYFASDFSAIYNLEDGRVSPIFPSEHEEFSQSSSIWVTPALYQGNVIWYR